MLRFQHYGIIVMLTGLPCHVRKKSISLTVSDESEANEKSPNSS